MRTTRWGLAVAAIVAVGTIQGVAPAVAETPAPPAEVSQTADGGLTYRDPSLDDESTRRITGVLRQVDGEDGDDLTVIMTNAGTVVPVDFDAAITTTEAPITADLVQGPDLTSALKGREAEPAEVASADVSEPAATTPVVAAHRAYVAVVTNSGSISATPTVNARVDAGLNWWKTEAGAYIPSFSRAGDSVSFASSLSNPCDGLTSTGYTAMTTEAAKLFNVNFNASGNHLVVVVSGDCSAVGRGSIGASIGSGGTLVMADKAPIFTSTLAHELGHNVSLRHANLCAGACSSTEEYWNLFSPMGLAVSGGSSATFEPTALDTVYRSQLGITDSGEFETVGTGQSVTRSLVPRGSSSGLRGIEVRDGSTSYWIDYRSGAGRDASSFYARANGRSIGSPARQYPVGITVMRQPTDSVEPTTVMATSAGVASYSAGQTFTAGQISVAVNSLGANASVTVSQTGSPSLSAGTPTINGTPQVGRQLTASPGTWSPTPDGYDYQWLADGATISGATQSTYTPTATQKGVRISVRVTGKKAGYTSATVTSAQSNAVADGTFSAGTPTISGTAKVGVELTASPGAWSPAADSYSYQWRAGGTDISGATLQKFTPSAAQQGAVITVRVTASKTAYSTASAVSGGTAPVAAGTLAPGQPTITGEVRVGRELSADPGTWSPDASPYSYQWLADGEPIAGATEQTYTPGAEQRGAQLQVLVTGSATGYDPATALSDLTDRVAPGAFIVGTPSIIGKARVGSTLSASTGMWLPTPDHYAYQWSANGKPIAGATLSTYVLTGDEAGKAVTVRVTATRDGYDAADSTSDATATVDEGELVASDPKVTGTAQVGKSLSATPGQWTAGTTFTWQWQADGKSIAGATKPTFTLTAAQQGRRITVLVEGSKPGYLTALRRSAATSAVKAGTLTAATPKISGTATVGKKLTVSRGTWSSGVTFTYRWYASGKAISGATKTSFTVTKSQKGKKLTVKVTGVKAGYTTVSKTSASTAKVS